ncbi:MAG: Flp pilus assembly complex ATPase component TadA [Flavobacteriales bacterium]|nr:Flp pilus assembly complex ATPase component TadA [Flavobacteriales bacterium]
MGETRDGAVARQTCNAALTGHLVVTSFHTNDAPSAITRMRSMGVALPAVQRVAGRHQPAPGAPHLPGVPPGSAGQRSWCSRTCRPQVCWWMPPASSSKGNGCDKCNGEGFKGRVGVYELLLMSPKVRNAISQEKPQMGDIRAAAMDGSYVPLARFSTHLLTQGYTVPSEIIRILPRDEQPLGM